jgi:RNA polymerase sigma factor (sigma-70 family)
LEKSKSENGGVVMEIVTYCRTKGMARYGCAQAGCRECLEGLLKEHRNLVRVMAMRQMSGKLEYGDLIQVGRIGLWHAILSFDERRGVCFSTYACVIIVREIWMAVKKSRKAEGWLESKRGGDSLEELIEKWYEEQIRQALREELEVLPKRLREVIELHYGLNGQAPQNLSEIGRGWGLSRERIRQLHNEALVLLRLPALSIHLRSICERGERENYRQALRQNQNWQHKVRGRR